MAGPGDGVCGRLAAVVPRRVLPADAVAALLSADEAPKYWPQELFGDWRLDSVREVLLHVLVETATHAGHLDAARELIDGKQWIVLDD
jgi:hypothetical protein